MKLITTIKEIREIVSEWKKAGKTVGLVPTMGYLHEGHQSLIRQAHAENDKVVVSVFVNPTQFSANEDLSSYPRDIENDLEKSHEAGASLIFHPEVSEMYPDGFNTYIEAFGVTEVLEGASRPTHFRGVTTVVGKLFNIVQPDRAYFGQKDAQQAAVIEQMVRDLNFPVKVVCCPIIREEDGLAKSSRNVYLSEEEREAALVLSQSLKLAKKMLEQGEKSAEKIKQTMTEKIQQEPLAEIDYIKIVDHRSLQDVAVIEAAVLIPIAVRIGNTRLIDNFVFGE
ncbi:pantoate--beta-alanine ligase [Enterococcus sp. 669A]|uniref:Pantothenate synthetase n=1 Tax=Candidatus Enterococcus moelleringii TaxID=2815325 RepID=A0ABS3LEK1_9ENTE|nr:pantoate--beta-alanine ligase [Enterococcus sp. 669A]MBO1308064.1 pantoate--beta-alanine ligase [Enterococcus sp. 669A]